MKKPVAEEKLDLGLAVLLTLLGVLGLAIGILALMAFAPVILSLASAYVAYQERARARTLAAQWPAYRWMARLWQLFFWGILAVAAVLLVAAWFEYALVYNEVKVAVLTALDIYTLPYLWLFGSLFLAVVLLMALERGTAAFYRHWHQHKAERIGDEN